MLNILSEANIERTRRLGEGVLDCLLSKRLASNRLKDNDGVSDKDCLVHCPCHISFKARGVYHDLSIFHGVQKRIHFGAVESGPRKA